MQTSVMQRVGWLSHSKKNKIVADAWYIDKSMRIPDLMGITSYYVASQKDSVIRGSIAYTRIFNSTKKVFEASKLEAGVVGGREFQRYTNFISSANEYSVFSEVTSTSLQNRISFDNYFSDRSFHYLAELRYTNVRVDNSNYKNNQYVEPFLAVNSIVDWNIIPTTFSAKAFYYQEWRSTYQSVPSFGASVTTQVGRRRNVTIEISGAHKFRIPDFNERFWAQGGNPNLKSERGWMGHVFADYFILKSKKNTLDVSARYSIMDMQQMIQWIPLDVWTAVNFANVRLQTIECIAHYTRAWNRLQWMSDFRISSNFNQTTLLYTPQTSLFASTDFVYRKWDMGWQARWVGSRYFETGFDNPRSLDPYAVHDVFLGWKNSIDHPLFSIRIFVENIFDTRYEMVRAYALPGRVFGVQLNFNPLNIRKSK
ncbi:MAG: TonB-dependent receptor [Flavobacteriales bacterium]